MIELPYQPHGLPVIARAALLDHGLSDVEIRSAILRGDLERPARGVVCEPCSDGSRHVQKSDRYVHRAMAHALRVPSCVLSHLSAAALHGLPISVGDLRTVHLTYPESSGARRTAGLWRHASALTDDEIVIRRGLRVTTAARTLVDLAQTESTRAAVAVIDAALHDELVTPDDLARALHRARRRHGIGSARRACALADGRSESVGESLLRVGMVQCGLPTPDVQVVVRSAAGRFLGRCDLGYRQHAVLIEFDGEVKYRGALRPGESATDAVIREKAREDRLREAGFVIIRVTWSDLGDLGPLARRIRRGIVLGGRAVAAGVVTGTGTPSTPLTVPFPG